MCISLPLHYFAHCRQEADWSIVLCEEFVLSALRDQNSVQTFSSLKKIRQFLHSVDDISKDHDCSVYEPLQHSVTDAIVYWYFLQFWGSNCFSHFFRVVYGGPCERSILFFLVSLLVLIFTCIIIVVFVDKLSFKVVCKSIALFSSVWTISPSPRIKGSRLRFDWSIFSVTKAAGGSAAPDERCWFVYTGCFWHSGIFTNTVPVLIVILVSTLLMASSMKGSV